MNRNEFINTLFDNGQGLTLDQIQTVDNYLSNSIPNIRDDIQELMKSNDNLDFESARQILIDQERQLFLDEMNSCSDLLKLKDFLTGYLPSNSKLSDMQVYRLSYLK